MKNLEKYSNAISDIIETGIINPTEVLNRLYEQYFKANRKRKYHECFNINEIILKFSDALTEKNKEDMAVMFSVFIAFYPYLCNLVPQKIQCDLVLLHPKDIIIYVMNNQEKKLLELALIGHLGGIQDIILAKEDKGRLIIKQLCKVVNSNKHILVSATALNSLEDAGNIIPYMPKSIRTLVLKTLIKEYQDENRGYTKSDTVSALASLIPTLGLSEQIKLFSKYIQAQFCQKYWYDWKFNAKILNAIEKIYPMTSKSRRLIIRTLLNNRSHRFDAIRALSELQYTLILEPDLAYDVINRLVLSLKSKLRLERRIAASTLNQCVHIITDSNLNTFIRCIAEYVTSLPVYAITDVHVKNLEPLIMRCNDGGAEFFEILTQAIERQANALTIIRHLIYWQNAITSLPDKGFKLLSACLKVLATTHAESVASRYGGEVKFGNFIEAISKLEQSLQVIPSIFNDFIAMLIDFRLSDPDFSHTSSAMTALLNLSISFNQLDEKTHNKLNLIQDHLKVFSKENQKSFSIPEKTNKTICFKDISFTQDIEITDYFWRIFQSLSSNHLKQLSWTCVVLQFFKKEKNKRFYCAGKALGQFYAAFFQKESLQLQIPVNDVVNIVQTYVGPR